MDEELFHLPITSQFKSTYIPTHSRTNIQHIPHASFPHLSASIHYSACLTRKSSLSSALPASRAGL